ncbi:MarR family transcriptional regulator [Arthrobacter sp. SRS-W-1-2016]|jgi:DNA-binding MarR family transcriptional regulator|uniref:MarR family winged helix-turn-helix transcriptional regulator n=1 Tax=Arthrobacter TaxID=1663 RepID=UPI0009914D62|nr:MULTISPECIES: MarR family transcriptional regulator [Arthrobacter]MDQ0210775.1 DNA-binding MarR family transcriptional regulator [Arthrobacter bambusae]MDQ0235448.1 DNA-binding MarR family transcriptional regulator [Arthrobacter bambusae]OOP59466.1 MarR family transcriptional regulator [Arthrobacter sp. SRS-W-1-2016]
MNPTPDADAAGTLEAAAELRVLIGQLTRRLREQSQVDNLTNAQKAVLIHLERDGRATLSALARAEGMRPQSMGAIISALSSAGLVESGPDPADGRQRILSLTAEARESISASRAAKADWLYRTILSKLTPDEREQLPGAVHLLKRLLEP